MIGLGLKKLRVTVYKSIIKAGPTKNNKISDNIEKSRYARINVEFRQVLISLNEKFVAIKYISLLLIYVLYLGHILTIST